MNKGIRERVWSVMEDWFEGDEEQSVLMTWPDGKLPGGQRVRALGIPRNDLVRLDGIYLARRDVDEETLRRLEEQLRDEKPHLVVVPPES
jgi:CRISPR-associated protein Cas2